MTPIIMYFVQPFYGQGPPLVAALPTPPPTLHARYLQNCAKMTVLPAAVCRGGDCQPVGTQGGIDLTCNSASFMNEFISV